MIISHEHPLYPQKEQHNGAYHYSKAICDFFIPTIETDRNWITINIPNKAVNHSVVFIHSNKGCAKYEFLHEYQDLVLVCGVPNTIPKVNHLGRAIYLPLSIDTEYVSKFKRKKTKEYAYVGRPEKRDGVMFPEGTDFIENLPREELLRELAKYKKVFAVGLCALEALCLGCEVLPYDDRYPDPSIWRVLDCRDAAKLLQTKLDIIDKRSR